MLLSFASLALLQIRNLPAQVDTTYAVSTTFTLDTRDVNAPPVAVSAAFTMDTRPAIGQTTSNDSATFPLDTRGSVAVAIGFQQAGAGFGSRVVGTTTDKIYTLTNHSGSRIFGTISVTGPFRIVGDTTYNLAPGESKTVTIRFTPSAPGSFSGTLTLSGGTGYTTQITASAIENPASRTGTIAGRITRSDTGLPVEPVTVKLLGSGDTGSIGRMTLIGVEGAEPGYYRFEKLPPGDNYRILVIDWDRVYYNREITGVTVTAGQVTTRNIALTPIPPELKPPELTVEETPVVLVQGMGPDLEWNAFPGASDYWEDFRNGLYARHSFWQLWDCNEPESDVAGGNGHVINGELPIEGNAASLWQYIRDKCVKYKNSPFHPYYPPKINIVAHSMGGLVTRRLLKGHGSLDYRDPGTGVRFTVKVDTVVMLGTSNAGNLVADFADKHWMLSAQFVPILGNSRASIADLTTASVAEFNSQCFWPDDVRLYLHGGGGGPASSNFWLRHVGDRAVRILARADAEKVNDGVVQWPSVQGILYSRLSSQTVERVQSFSPSLAAPAAFYSDKDHDLLRRAGMVPIVVANLQESMAENTAAPEAAAALAAMRTAKPGAPMSAGEGTGFAMQQIEDKVVTLAAGGTSSWVVPSDSATQLSFDLLTSGSDVGFSLRDPSDTVIDPSTSGGNVEYSDTALDTGFVASYVIANPAPGEWTVVLTGPAAGQPEAPCQVSIHGDSSLALIVKTGSAFNGGQDVVVGCELAEAGAGGSTPVVNGTVNVTIHTPVGGTQEVSLFDDGLHGDGAPGDGLYAAVISSLTEAGRYDAEYRATGTNAAGQSFQRVASEPFRVSSQNGSLLGDPEYGLIDTDGDGMADYLKLNCWVNPLVSGTFHVSAELVNPTGSLRFGGSMEFEGEADAASGATILYDLGAIRAAGGIGEFQLQNLQLSEVVTDGVKWVDSYHGTSSFRIGPNITSSPQSQPVEEGTAAALSVAADSSMLSCQWLFNGTPIPGATGATLNIGTVNAATAGAYAVAVTNETGTVTTPAATLTVTPATTFAHWRQARFTSGQLDDPAVSGPDTDPADAGMANLLKYAFGSNPFLADRSVLPMPGSELNPEDGKDHWTFSYRQRIASTDLACAVEVSDDLIAWDSSGNQLEQAGAPVANGDGVTQTVTVRLKAPIDSLAKKFVRLRVTGN